MKFYKHIVWDWNGTLLDDAWLCVEIINELLHKRGLPILTRERYQEVFGFPLKDYCRRLGFNLEKESFEQISDEFVSLYEQRRLECQLQPNAVEIFTAVQQARRQQSILSAYQQQALEKMVKYFHLEGFFTQVLGVDNCYGDGKIERGRRWLRELPCTADEIVLIGDLVHDSDVAASLGIDCILIPSGHQNGDRLVRERVVVVEKLIDVLGVVGIDSKSRHGK
jgi:phosphoglycolate phosphatase